MDLKKKIYTLAFAFLIPCSAYSVNLEYAKNSVYEDSQETSESIERLKDSMVQDFIDKFEIEVTTSNNNNNFSDPTFIDYRLNKNDTENITISKEALLKS